MSKNIIFIIKKEKNDNSYLKWIYSGKSYDHYVHQTDLDNKWKSVYEIKLSYFKKIKKKKTITFVDADVDFTGDLDDYLETFINNNLQYASPAYKSSDFFSPNECVLRYVNYIPIKFITFSFTSFDSLDEIFNYNESGAGIDWVIPKLFEYEGVSIIDKCFLENNYKKNDEKFIVKDLVKIYNEFELSSFYNVEFDRIDKEEIRDPFCNIKLANLNKITKMKFSRPSRRSNGCLDSDTYLSDRMMMSTGGPWMP
jgi:hypothetical protein